MKHAVEETCCVVTLTTMTELKCKHFVIVVILCIAVVNVGFVNLIMDLTRITITIVYEVIFTSCLHQSFILFSVAALLRRLFFFVN